MNILIIEVRWVLQRHTHTHTHTHAHTDTHTQYCLFYSWLNNTWPSCPFSSIKMSDSRNLHQTPAVSHKPDCVCEENKKETHRRVKVCLSLWIFNNIFIGSTHPSDSAPKPITGGVTIDDGKMSHWCKKQWQCWEVQRLNEAKPVIFS